MSTHRSRSQLLMGLDRSHVVSLHIGDACGIERAITSSVDSAENASRTIGSSSSLVASLFEFDENRWSAASYASGFTENGARVEFQLNLSDTSAYEPRDWRFLRLGRRKLAGEARLGGVEKWRGIMSPLKGFDI